VLGRMQAVLDGIPADDRNANGSVLFSKERLHETIILQRETLRLMANMLALSAYTADTDGVLTWLTEHRTRLAAASILMMFADAEVVP
jgi:hypothetical protein